IHFRECPESLQLPFPPSDHVRTKALKVATMSKKRKAIGKPMMKRIKVSSKPSRAVIDSDEEYEAPRQPMMQTTSARECDDQCVAAMLRDAEIAIEEIYNKARRNKMNKSYSTKRAKVAAEFEKVFDPLLEEWNEFNADDSDCNQIPILPSAIPMTTPTAPPIPEAPPQLYSGAGPSTSIPYADYHEARQIAM